MDYSLMRRLRLLLSHLLGFRPTPVRHQLLQAARRAPLLLGASTPLVRDFLLSRRNPDGGFQGRTPESDLYYTLFGLQAQLALEIPLDLPSTAAYLQTFGDGTSLDFIHLCCLARCHALLQDGGFIPPPAHLRVAIARRIETHRTPDGGYHLLAAQPTGTPYAAFLALSAYDDLRFRLPDPKKLARSLQPLRTADGAWTNERHAPTAATNPTAAALSVLAQLHQLANYPQASQWILAQAHPLGGFRASPLAPIPDLLSTATALHLLAATGQDLSPLREPCLNFIDSLWNNQGGFHGHWDDDHLDVEYTFYGLLALGQLAGKSHPAAFSI